MKSWSLMGLEWNLALFHFLFYRSLQLGHVKFIFCLPSNKKTPLSWMRGCFLLHLNKNALWFCLFQSIFSYLTIAHAEDRHIHVERSAHTAR